MVEIITFEQQRLTRVLRQCIRTAIADIQRGTMPPLPKLPPTFAGKLRLFGIHVHNFNLQAVQQQIQLTPASFAFATFNHDAAFQQGKGTHQTFGVIEDSSGDSFGFWFTQ